MKLIYVAGAYSGATPEEIDLNIEAARKIGQLCVRKNWYPIIPHANTAGFDRVASEVSYNFWIEGTLEAMRRCDAVIMVPGWECSGGAVGEIEIANQLEMDVYFDTLHLPEAPMPRVEIFPGQGKSRIQRALDAWVKAHTRMMKITQE